MIDNCIITPPLFHKGLLYVACSLCDRIAKLLITDMEYHTLRKSVRNKYLKLEEEKNVPLTKP
jgi:hypothetical protein